MGRCTIARHGPVNASAAPRSLTPGQALPGSVMIGFADGHSRLVRLEDLWAFTWHRSWEAPAKRPDVGQ
jgi:prepilin-type processing-associated H-X9-DG protein